MSRELETLEMESLGELEDEIAGEGEDEAFLGGILRGVTSLMGEHEWEDEAAHEWEDEFGFHEVAHEAGHEGEWEDEASHEWEMSHELFAEHEQEQFFKKAFRGIGRFVKNNAGLLK